MGGLTFQEDLGMIMLEGLGFRVAGLWLRVHILPFF